MQSSNNKYQAFKPVEISDRTWPSKSIEVAPIWCSVDLRDGNQALVDPMSVEKKVKFFNQLVKMGYKEIEVGFPSASDTDFQFVRRIIEEGLVPSDVTIQVLVQAREELIEKTFAALQGAHKAIVHLYNSTSVAQRKIVFNMDQEQVIELAVDAAEKIKFYAEAATETQWTFQYSPESFTGTELEFAADICNSVINVWQPTPSHKVIINLPATVEMSTPNIYADQVEWMHRALTSRESVILSVHPHNDRGTAVAAAELAVMAGADRVEGTLFGNGERTGNVDLVTLGLNLYTQGVDPKIDFSNITEVMQCAEYCNQLPVHPRHPYAGELVFTAFSGSHQDAIKKGFEKQEGDTLWEVPYLPIDPSDIGRSYEAIIRVNSQSGKAGSAFILEQDYGYQLPRALQIEFSEEVQKVSDATSQEIVSQEILDIFDREFVNIPTPIELVSYRINATNTEDVVEAIVEINGERIKVNGRGNGPVSAFTHGINKLTDHTILFNFYSEHSLQKTENAEAAAYVQLGFAGATPHFGVGRSDNIVEAAFLATVAATNILITQQGLKLKPRLSLVADEI